MPESSRGKPRRSPRAAAWAVALPWAWTAPLEWRLASGRDWLAGALAREVEQRRLFPWIAVCFGVGILLFFHADKPSLWAPLGAFGLCSLAGALLRRNLAAFSVMVALAAVFAGFSAGIIRARSVAAPVLARITIAPVTGFIEAVEDRDEGKRLLLRVASIKGVADAERPRLVRVSVRKGEGLTAGEFIGGTARLLPPPQPAWPGGYDFARDAYYKGIGAVGSFTGAVRRLDPPAPPDLSLRVAAGVDEARNALTQRIAASIGGPAGGSARPS